MGMTVRLSIIWVWSKGGTVRLLLHNEYPSVQVHCVMNIALVDYPVPEHTHFILMDKIAQ